MLPAEVLEKLEPKPGEAYLDLTLGGAGHALLVAERIGPTGKIIALDRDADALARSSLRLQQLASPPALSFHHANFQQVRELLKEESSAINLVLADLGFSSDQMDDPERGLSFMREGPLDMRLDRTERETAADILSSWREKELADLFWKYGEERKSRWVAKRVVETRKAIPITTTTQLAELVRSCVPRSGNIDPATRVFQALRIAVNDELGALETLLQDLPYMVAPGARVGIISFHSLEDRLVKYSFRQSEFWEVLTKKPIEASEEESRVNPRSRSAKLRVARRVG